MEEITGLELNSNLMNDLHQFPVVVTGAQDAAEQIAERAREMAPVDTGNYRDGIRAERSNKQTSGVWRVVATDQKSSWVEFGTFKDPGQFVLRQAAESLGFKFVKKRG